MIYGDLMEDLVLITKSLINFSNISAGSVNFPDPIVTVADPGFCSGGGGHQHPHFSLTYCFVIFLPKTV